MLASSVEISAVPRKGALSLMEPQMIQYERIPGLFEFIYKSFPQSLFSAMSVPGLCATKSSIKKKTKTTRTASFAIPQIKSTIKIQRYLEKIDAPCWAPVTKAE